MQYPWGFHHVAFHFISFHSADNVHRSHFCCSRCPSQLLLPSLPSLLPSLSSSLLRHTLHRHALLTFCCCCCRRCRHYCRHCRLYVAICTISTCSAYSHASMPKLIRLLLSQCLVCRTGFFASIAKGLPNPPLPNLLLWSH